jgi:hypothetical protein
MLRIEIDGMGSIFTKQETSVSPATSEGVSDQSLVYIQSLTCLQMQYKKWESLSMICLSRVIPERRANHALKCAASSTLSARLPDCELAYLVAITI